MNTWLAAPRGRIKTRPVLVALAAVAVVLTAAVPATARTTSNSTAVLAQGAGMGDRPSPAVRTMQRVLDRRGYALGAPGVDGRFGPLTDAAVRAAQSDSGLVVDGLVGPRTRRALGLTPRSRDGAGSTPRRRTRAPSTRPAPKVGRPVAHPQPVPSVETSPSTARDNTLWILVGLAAIVAFVVSLLAFGRRSPERRGGSPTTAVTPISHDVFVEGHNDEIGDFRGRVIAATVTTDPAGADATRYLVDDPRRRVPVWVQEADIGRSPTPLAATEPVIGYVTLSPDGPQEEADGPAQAIAEACDRAGWQLVDVVTDRETGRGLERPGLTYALEQIAERKARGLVISDLQRVSRSTIEIGALLEWFRDADAALVALDLGIDTSTVAGQDLANTLITLSGWERDRITRRTRSGLAEVGGGGGMAGRLRVADRAQLGERIAAMRSANMTLQAIADQLTAEGVPTMHGHPTWQPVHVQAALGFRRSGERGPREQLPSLGEEGDG
jgi:DNA invertase Pin-like site-specific DNA recombinase/peptidoglycan hydrolase-like protein with peptidoglycan-binding domain